MDTVNFQRHLLMAALAVLNRLFKTAHFGGGGVIVALHLTGLLLLGFMFCAFGFYGGVNFAQQYKQTVMLGGHLVQPAFQLGNRLMVAIPAHCQQFQLKLALLFFKASVFFGFFRLFLQVLKLFINLFAQIIQTLKVFPRVFHTGFGFLAAFFVFGNARRFFDVDS